MNKCSKIFYNMTNKILTAAALVLMAVACNTETQTPLQYGELSVALTGEPSVEVVTKAPETLDPASDQAKNYTVRIFDSSDAPVYEKAFNEFEAQRLTLGTYYVTAENCTATAAEEGKGMKRLYGRSADITLSAEALSQTATVNCTVANARVAVAFDASTQGRFTDLKVVLSPSGRNIEIAQTAVGVETETWFNPSTVEYTITGTFSAGGVTKEVNIDKSVTVEAKNNVLLLVKVNLENGQLMPNVTVDASIDNQVEVPSEFNPYI